MTNLTVFATYRLDPANEEAFVELFPEHEAVLRRHDLLDTAPPRIYRQQTDEGVTFVEIFDWRPNLDQTPGDIPEVAAIWHRMIRLCTSVDFPHYARWNA
ncbi:MAG: hypothetical protein AAGA48_30535 [Myxococcota bacterium]